MEYLCPVYIHSYGIILFKMQIKIKSAIPCTLLRYTSEVARCTTAAFYYWFFGDSDLKLLMARVVNIAIEHI